MKRNFRGFGQTHGTHAAPPAPGRHRTAEDATGSTNKKMPGHYGVEQVTTQNPTVVDVDAEKNLLLVKGAIPGHNDGIVFVRPSVKVALREAHAGKK
jgi:large subunit ribosomal protein L3